MRKREEIQEMLRASEDGINHFHYRKRNHGHTGAGAPLCDGEI